MLDRRYRHRKQTESEFAGKRVNRDRNGKRHCHHHQHSNAILGGAIHTVSLSLSFFLLSKQRFDL